MAKTFFKSIFFTVNISVRIEKNFRYWRLQHFFFICTKILHHNEKIDLKNVLVRNNGFTFTSLHKLSTQSWSNLHTQIYFWLKVNPFQVVIAIQHCFGKPVNEILKTGKRYYRSTGFSRFFIPRLHSLLCIDGLIIDRPGNNGGALKLWISFF